MTKRDRQLAARGFLENLQTTLEQGDPLDVQQQAAVDAMLSHVPSDDVFSPTNLLYRGLQDVDSLKGFDLEEQDFRTAYGASQRSKNRLEGLCNGIFDMHMANKCREMYPVPNDGNLVSDARTCALLSGAIAKQMYGTEISVDDAFRYSMANYLYANDATELGPSSAQGALLALCEAKGKPVEQRFDLVPDGCFAKGVLYEACMNSMDQGYLQQLPSDLSLLDKTVFFAVGNGMADVLPDHAKDVLARNADHPEPFTPEQQFLSVLSDCEIYLEDPENPGHLRPDLRPFTDDGVLDRTMRSVLDSMSVQESSVNSEPKAEAPAVKTEMPKKAVSPKGSRFVLQNAFPTKDGKGYMAQISFANDLPQRDGKYLAGTACTHRSYTDSKGQQKMNFTTYYSKSQIDAITQAANSDGDKPVFRANYFKKGGDVIVNANTAQRDPVPFNADLHKQHTQEVRAERAAAQKLDAPQVDTSVSMEALAAQAGGPELG